ncbi:MAG: Clp protease N-terminal domain-containing protein [Streptosporangiaceae bacterium]
MIGLDVADLIVIASEVLGCDTGTALAQADIVAGQDALAEAGRAGQARSPGGVPARAPGEVRGMGPGGASPHRGDASEAAVALMDALLRHPPFPAHREQMAVAAGLQFLAVNGWQANLDVPRAAVIVISRLASGQLTPAQAASWLAARLTPDSGWPPGKVPMLSPRSPVAQIARAVRRRYRRGTRPSPLIIHIGPGDGPGGIITPVTGPMAFTGHARKALVLARQESSRLGRPRGPEHILLGLANAGDGLAVKALERLGVRPEAIREQVGQVTGQEPDHPSGPSPEARPTLRVWHAMVDEAVAQGDDCIGTDHFLLALFCEDNAAAQVLTRLGAGERAVRAAVAELLAESGRERSA